MKGTVECIRCHAHMESGWVADKTHRGVERQNWSPGEPQPSFWTRLKLEKDQLISVTTFRCPNCGYLESYALLQTISDG
jgi:predicted nucleic-acid-binding Zn-ribbon protein